MASERCKADIAYAITPFKLIIWPIGVWPLQVYNVYSLIRWILVTCCMSMVVILLFTELYMGCTDAEQNIDCLLLICCGILAITKTIWFRIYADNLTNNYSSAVNDYLTIENAEHRAIMRKYASMGRILYCSIMSVSYFDSILLMMNALLANKYNNKINMTNEDTILKYTLPSRCTLEYLGIPSSMCETLCFIECIMVVIISTGNLGNDCLFLNITLHVCGQVKILSTSFLDFDVENPHIYEHFNALIRRHGYLIKLTRKLADVINFILLMQLFISSVLICILGFQFILALKINDVAMMTKSFMILCTVLVQLAVYSYVGDYLISQMEEVWIFICQSCWYDLPIKLARNLIFIIMRAQSPIRLQAGNFVVVNLSTYMSIIKTSISYLSLLRVMVEI